MEHLLNTKMFYVAFISYSCAIVAYLILLATEKRFMLRISIFFMILGFLFHTLGIVFRTIELRHPPLANMFEYMTVLAWFACIGYFILLKLVKNWLSRCVIWKCHIHVNGSRIPLAQGRNDSTDAGSEELLASDSRHPSCCQ